MIFDLYFPLYWSTLRFGFILIANAIVIFVQLSNPECGSVRNISDPVSGSKILRIRELIRIRRILNYNIIILNGVSAKVKAAKERINVASEMHLTWPLCTATCDASTDASVYIEEK